MDETFAIAEKTNRLAFHPWRLASILQFDAGFDLAAIGAQYDAAVGGSAATPLERSVERSLLLRCAGLARAVRSTRILDASGDLPKTGETSPWEDVASAGPYFVQLGRDRFPSPAFGCCIEGAYVQVVHDGSTMEVNSILCAGPDIHPRDELHAPFDSPEEMLRQQLRITFVDLDIVNGEPMIRSTGYSQPSDWTPFVRGPLLQALRALRMHVAGGSRSVLMAGDNGWRLNLLSRSFVDEPPPNTCDSAIRPDNVVPMLDSLLSKVDMSDDVFVRDRMASRAEQYLAACRSAGYLARLPHDEAERLERSVERTVRCAHADFVDRVVMLDL